MRESENYSRIYEALAKVVAEIPTMPKNCKGYGYNYTSLETIQNTIKPIMNKHGLTYIQPLNEVNGIGAITTRIFTLDGKDFVEFTTPLPVGEMAKMNNVQAMGATITYYRRYAICSFLGILADDDIDARTFEIEQKQKNLDEAKKDPEIAELCKTLDKYEEIGVLKGRGLETVKSYIQSGDKAKLREIITWCAGEVEKKKAKETQ